MSTSPNKTKSSARLVDITSNNAGQRVDNYLLTQLKGVPKSHIYRLLRSGQVRVNSGRKKPSYRLVDGDTVRIPPVRMSEPKAMNAPDSVINHLLDSKLYEDDNLLIINKPSGIPVHSGSGYDFGVIEALRKPYNDQFLELVHRLDRETSGCLILAKNRPALTRINALFSESKTHALQKNYHALVQGSWPNQLLTVNAPLLKTKRGGEHMVEVNETGSHAITHFNCEHHYPLASLLDVKIETGRTHQIRVHCAHNGHPIAGDKKYGTSTFNKSMKKLGLTRLFLHARRIEIDLDKTITAVAPLSEDLKSVLKKLQ